jgi:hypothetical protein
MAITFATLVTLLGLVLSSDSSPSGGTALLKCVNPGGNSPPPKQVAFGPLQGQITFIQPRNGQITGSATIGQPLLPGASQICPNPNWSVAQLSITYFDVVLRIQQNNLDILVQLW